uniref:Uncharacterized protein n=1 Tax=Cyanoderma ruficeps TaxID=181631 RepID=A0A8C3NT60_9PASS
SSPHQPEKGLAAAPGCALTLCFWVPGDALPSPNVGLPSALVPREPPGPAYVTHTGPLVRLLLVQEGLGWAARGVPAVPARPRPRTEPRGPAEPSPERGTGSGTAGTREGSTGIPAGPASAPPSVHHRIIFARKPPSAALPRSDLARNPSVPGC